VHIQLVHMKAVFSESCVYRDFVPSVFKRYICVQYHLLAGAENVAVCVSLVE